MIKAVYDILAADATVSTNATGGIWIDDVPQTKTAPYVVVSSVDGRPIDTKEKVADYDQVIVQVTAYGIVPYTKSSNIGAWDLIDDCRDALDHYDSTINGTTLYCEAQSTPTSINLSIPNYPLWAYEMEFLIDVRR